MITFTPISTVITVLETITFLIDVWDNPPPAPSGVIGIVADSVGTPKGPYKKLVTEVIKVTKTILKWKKVWDCGKSLLKCASSLFGRRRSAAQVGEQVVDNSIMAANAMDMFENVFGDLSWLAVNSTAFADAFKAAGAEESAQGLALDANEVGKISMFFCDICDCFYL